MPLCFTEAGVCLEAKKVNPQITDIMVCVYIVKHPCSVF